MKMTISGLIKEEEITINGICNERDFNNELQRFSNPHDLQRFSNDAGKKANEF